MQPLDSAAPFLNDSTRFSIRYEERLAMALNFNVDDLTANRLGAITGRQANRMRTHMLNDARQIVIGLFGGAVAVVLLALLRANLPSTVSAENQDTLETALLILIAVAVIGILGFALQRGLSAYHHYKDTQSLRSTTTQGYLKLEGPPTDKVVVKKRRWNAPRFYATVDGKRFQVPEIAYLAMKKGEPYVIYYAPLSKVMLSAERLRNERELSHNSSTSVAGRTEVQLSRS